MGKRSSFERNPRDYYRTPLKAVVPLMPHINNMCCYAEPCAGDGQLIRNIGSLSNCECVIATDVEPQSKMVKELNAFDLILPTERNRKVDFIITNPPWDRKILHPIIEHFRNQADTWLLFDADWIHTQQSRAFMPYCAKIVSIGRISWMENGVSGKDNCAWYLFKKEKVEFTQFVGRIE